MMYSVVIPVFQAKTYLEQSLQRVLAAMDSLHVGYEIILVDDHSTDGTWDLVKQLKAQYPDVRAIRLDRNVGQTPATLIGAQKARGQRIITLDDDLQHPPEEIPKLIAAFEQNDVDIVFGDPENRHHAYRQHPALVSFGTFLFHKVFMRRYSKLNFFTTFRLFDSKLLRSNGGNWVNLFFIWQLNPDRAMHVSTKHEGRKQGSSNHTLAKLLRHFSPFIWYFAMQGALAMQLVLLGFAVSYLLFLTFTGTPINKPAAMTLVGIAFVFTLVKRVAFYRMMAIERPKYTATEI